ncbi:MAG: hypothetical protein ABFS46_08220 [Myxococcota bacterium]
MYRGLLDLGVALDELRLRLPVLAAGIATVVLLPRAVQPWIGVGAARAFAWWLALSPALVLFSRVVRYYAPKVLLASLAAAAFAHWWTRRTRRSAFLYATLAAAAIHVHLFAAPFALAPLLFGALALALGRGGAPPL